MAQAETRKWTDTQNRTVEAEFAGKEGDQVKLKLPNGNVIPFPLAKLSVADQKYVAEKGEGIPNTTAASKDKVAPLGSKTASKTWPAEAGVGSSIEVKAVEEDDSSKSFIYRTEHFEFRSDAKLGTNVVKEFGRLFEAMHEAVRSLPLELDPQTPEGGFFVTQLFETKEDYFRKGGVPGSAGVYMGSSKQIMIPLESLGVKKVGSRYSIENREDNTTLLHELTHQLMHRWLNELPVWLVEGMAEYMATCKYKSGRISFAQHGKNVADYVSNQRGFNAKGFKMVALNKLMNMSDQEWSGAVGSGAASSNYASSALLAYYFCHLDGEGDGKNLIEYFKMLAGGSKNAEATDKALQRSRSMEELQKSVMQSWRRYGMDIQF